MRKDGLIILEEEYTPIASALKTLKQSFLVKIVGFFGALIFMVALPVVGLLNVVFPVKKKRVMVGTHSLVSNIHYKHLLNGALADYDIEIFVFTDWLNEPSYYDIQAKDILPLLDLAIVYTGTLALEASYIGVPVLMGGVNAYSNILNPDVSSDLNYWERLDSLCTCQNKISCRTIEDKVLSMLYNEYIDHEFLTEWTDDTNTYSRISGDWRASLLETSDYVKKIIMSTF